MACCCFISRATAAMRRSWGSSSTSDCRRPSSRSPSAATAGCTSPHWHKAGQEGRAAADERLERAGPGRRPAAGAAADAADARSSSSAARRAPRPPARPKQVKKSLGTEVIPIANEQVIEAMKAIDPKAAEAEAEKYWLSQAKKIVEPDDARRSSSRPDCTWRSRALMIKERAQAITSSHCMGNPRRAASPSASSTTWGWSAPARATWTRPSRCSCSRYAFGVPGFITDPVFDTAKQRPDPLPLHVGDEDGRPDGQAAAVHDPHADRQRAGRRPRGREPRRPGGHVRQVHQPRHDADLDRQDHRSDPRRTRLPHPVRHRGRRRPRDVPSTGAAASFKAA